MGNQGSNIKFLSNIRQKEKKNMNISVKSA